MMNKDNHPEQDPAEGSRETVEKDLKRQSQASASQGDDDHAKPNEPPQSSTGSEAAEPSPK
ncbi:hypothetical protein LVY75_33090 (plasmid) [Sinorhizobium sp. B11]|jgi:hypothetical protein